MASFVMTFPKPEQVVLTPKAPVRTRMEKKNAVPIPFTMEEEETVAELFSKGSQWSEDPLKDLEYTFTDKDIIFNVFRDGTWSWVRYNRDGIDNKKPSDLRGSVIEMKDTISDIFSDMPSEAAGDYDICYIKYRRESDDMYILYANDTWVKHKFEYDRIKREETEAALIKN